MILPKKACSSKFYTNQGQYDDLDSIRNLEMLRR